ncbi:MAG: hypothetical protein ACI8YQ_002636 [Polaribacter sp.]
MKYLEAINQIDFIDPENHTASNHDKIKWYEKPIVFGGDPNDFMWVDIDQHQKLVAFWNKIYYEQKT